MKSYLVCVGNKKLALCYIPAPCYTECSKKLALCYTQCTSSLAHLVQQSDGTFGTLRHQVFRTFQNCVL